MFTRAITRIPGVDFAQGLTTSQLGQPDYAVMCNQHAAYIEALRSLGLAVDVLDPLEGFPDAYFVEDAAVVIPELAVLTRPGAPSRREEPAHIEQALKHYRKLARIEAPGTLEGGDVLLVDKHFFIGLSERTNQEGAEQLRHLVEPYGYSCTMIPVAAGLHFKSSVNYAGMNTLLVTRGFADHPGLTGYEKIFVEPEEEYAANTLFVNGALIMPADFPSLRRKMERLGLPIIELNTSEARKMDGGLTCMSLRF